MPPSSGLTSCIATRRTPGIRVGDILTFEGGLGKTFYKIEMMGQTPVPSLVTSIGAVYYAQFKATADTGPAAVTPLLAGRKDRVYGAGVEGNLILPKNGVVLGLRIEPEFGARNRTQGWTFMLTLAYELKSLVKAPHH
jgi:hypothetical protein